MQIFALVTDLIFKSKIIEAAKISGKKVNFVDDFNKIENADLVFIDLEKFGSDYIPKIKEKNENAKIIGYLSHANISLKKIAENNQCIVMPRSEFSKKVKDLLFSS